MTKEFDKISYRKTLDFKNNYRLIFLILVITIFFKICKNFIDDCIVTKYLSHINGFLPIDFFFFGILLYSLFELFSKIYQQKHFPSLKTLFVLLLFLFFYVYLRCFQDYQFFYIYNSQIAYFDVIVLFIFIRLADFQPYFNLSSDKSNSTSNNDITTSNKKTKDLYNRDSHAKSVVETIINTTSNESISIGIFAEWGSGKTDFIQRMKSEFIVEKNKDQNIIMEFSPWLSSGKPEMVEDFFKQLGKTLKPYNSSISSKIKKYSANIFQTSKNEYSKLLDSIIEEIIPSKTISEEFKEIDDLIKRTGKRLVIFIDDLDRLTASEILEIFRIIRNSANFTNSFFVTTLDYDYVIQMLKESKEIVNEEVYLKKIFQTVITLPVIQKNTFKSQLQTFFNEDFKEERDQIEWSKLLEQICKQVDLPGDRFSNNNLVEDLIDNTRDLLIFYNSFKFSYQRLKGKVEIFDLALLELLKVSQFNLYQKIINNNYPKNFHYLGQEQDSGEKIGKGFTNLLNGVNPDTQFTPEQELDNFVSDSLKSTEIKKLIKKLFSPEKESSPKSISKFQNLINIDIYTTFQNPEDIVPRDKFYKLFNGINEDDFFDKIRDWSESDLARDLKNILDNFQDIKDYNSFKRINMARLLISERQDYYIDKIINLISKTYGSTKNNTSGFQIFAPAVYQIIDDDLIKFIEFVLNFKLNNSKKLVFLHSLKNEFMQTTIKYKDKPIQKYFEDEKFNKMIINIFEKALNENDDLINSDLVYSTSNAISDSNNRLAFAPKIIEIIKKQLLNNKKAFEKYLKDLVNKHSDKRDVFFPSRHLIPIFENKELFLEFLNNYKSDDSEIKRLKEIIIRQAEKIYPEKPGLLSFELFGSDLDFVNSLQIKNNDSMD
jgi:predicted KAP-like P-loop ATPase